MPKKVIKTKFAKRTRAYRKFIGLYIEEDVKLHVQLYSMAKNQSESETVRNLIHEHVPTFAGQRKEYIKQIQERYQKQWDCRTSLRDPHISTLTFEEYKEDVVQELIRKKIPTKLITTIETFLIDGKKK